MRRSHTLRGTRTSMPAGNVLQKVAAIDDLGVLSEERTTNLRNIDNVEAELRSTIFEKERVNDKLQDQIAALQAQLAQRPPLSTIQEIENEKRALELILQGTQRENEKMMIQLERGQTRQRVLEGELRKLCGENWQVSLNIAPAESPNLHTAGMSSFVANPNFSSSTLSLAGPSPVLSFANAKSTILPRSLVSSGSRPIHPAIKEDSHNFDSSYVTAADQTRAVRNDSDDGGDEDGDDEDDESAVEHALSKREGPTERELELERKNEILQQQIEQVKLLVLGLDKRLVDREERLNKTIQRAEQENRGLDTKLRELNVNAA